MAGAAPCPLLLRIPPCIHQPAHPHHPPPLDKPLRVHIEGPVSAVARLAPGAQWDLQIPTKSFPQEAGLALARITYRAVYGQDPETDHDLVIVDELLGWAPPTPYTQIDYYGITFDHRVPAADKDNPEVLQININELDDDGGAYANNSLLFTVNPADYTGKAVLAAPRCCQRRKSTTDRIRVNESVIVKRTGKWPTRTGAREITTRPVPIPDAVPLRRVPALPQ